MRKLNIFYSTFGSIYWEKEKKIICSIHENDGEIKEYFNPLFKHYGIKIVTHKKRPKWLTVLTMRYWGV